MLKIKINNIEFLVHSSLSVLEACQFVGINVPRFCYHEILSVAGNCRMCLVEIEKSVKPVASCALPITNNLSIFTDSPLVMKARENVLESLLINHPLDCPICDQGGECDLQDQVTIFGGDYSRYYLSKRVVESKPFGEFIKTVMTRCIHCTRCVRFSEEIAGTSSFGTLNRGNNTEIGSYVSNLFDSEISGTVIDLCPVGALTLKPYAFKARPWELRCYETIDCTTSLCTPIIVNIKESDIVRIQPKSNLNAENSIISDHIRFSYDSQKKNRIQRVFRKDNQNIFVNDKWPNFFKNIKNSIKKNKKITFLVNDTLDNHSIFFLKNLENPNLSIVNLSSFISNKKQRNVNFESNKLDFRQKQIKTCFLLSTNLRIETTLLNTKLRLKYNKNVFKTVNLGSFYKSNYPITFINLNINNIVKLFEGKLLLSLPILKEINPLLIVGNSVLKRITNISRIINIFKNVNATALVLQNHISVNSVGVNFFNLRQPTSSVLINTDYFFCVNLEDNIITRKFLLNKTFFWFNTHGSTLAAKAHYILPSSTFFESEGLFVNIEGMLSKSFKILPPLKESKNFLDLLSSSFIKKNVLNYPNFLQKILNKTLIARFNLDNIRNNFYEDLSYGYKIPLKGTLENSYVFNTFTKNSLILAKRFAELNKNRSLV